MSKEIYKVKEGDSPAAVRAKWVAALRSGEFAQGKYRLYNPERDTYCCLGVLEYICDGLVGPHGYCSGHTKAMSGLVTNAGHYGNGQALSIDNDSKWKTFNEIADIIVSEPYGLFRSDLG